MDFIEHRADGPVYETAPNIPVAHAFTTRFGGVSRGIYASLNLALNSGDEPSCVIENYRRLRSTLEIGPDCFVFSHQVHKTDIRLVGRGDMRAPFSPVPYDADGLITAEEEVPLIIFTADCIPILLYDPVRRAAGAVHAGWRGTARDIAGKTVREMSVRLGCSPQNIRAAIGPGISRCCFETGPEVPDAMGEILGCDAEAFIRPRGGKYMVDLKGINHALLTRAGVLDQNIAMSDECTVCRSDKYWSHRITRGRRGTQASLIMLKGNTPS